jgi:hypothetical protein
MTPYILFLYIVHSSGVATFAPVQFPHESACLAAIAKVNAAASWHHGVTGVCVPLDTERTGK